MDFSFHFSKLSIFPFYFTGLFQVPLRREVQDGHIKSQILQTVSIAKMLRNRHEKGIYSDGRRKGKKKTENRRKQVGFLSLTII